MLIDERKNIKDWFNRIKTRKTQCGQDEVAYDMLPNADETLHGRLRSIQISDY